MSISFYTHQDALGKLKSRLYFGELEIDSFNELICKLITDAKKNGAFSMQSVKGFVREKTTAWLAMKSSNVYDSMLKRIAEEYEKELTQAVEPAMAKWNSNTYFFRNKALNNDPRGIFDPMNHVDVSQVVSLIGNHRKYSAYGIQQIYRRVMGANTPFVSIETYNQVICHISNIEALRVRCREFDQMALVAREKGAEYAKKDPCEHLF